MTTDFQFSVMFIGVYLTIALVVGYQLQMSEPPNLHGIHGRLDILQLILLTVMGLFWPVVLLVWLYSKD